MLARTPGPTDAARGTTVTMKVLLAEDDARLRTALAMTLEREGFDVTRVKNGQEAWRALQEHHFPIVLTDWVMPELDGSDLLRAGLVPGPAVARGLSAALRAKLDGRAPDGRRQLAVALRGARRA